MVEQTTRAASRRDPSRVIYALMVASMGLGKAVPVGDFLGGDVRIWQLLMILLILLAFAKGALAGKAHFGNATAVLLVYPFLVATTLSSVNAIDLGFWLRRSVFSAALMGLFVVVAERRTAEQIVQNERWVIYPAMLVAGWGIAEVYLWPEKLQIHWGLPRARSFFEEANEFSQYLSLPFAFLLARMLYPGRLHRWELWASRIGLFVVVVAQVLTFSRGGLLAFLAEVMALFFLKAAGGIRIGRGLARATLTIVIPLGVAGLALSPRFTEGVLPAVWGRIGSTFSGDDYSAQDRLADMREGLASSVASTPNFLFGIGAGNLDLSPVHEATTSNYLVDVLTETGIAGLTAFCALVLGVLVLPLRTMRRLVVHADERLLAVFVGSYLGVVGLLLGGLTAATHMLNVFWFNSGLLLALHRCGNRELPPTGAQVAEQQPSHRRQPR